MIENSKIKLQSQQMYLENFRDVLWAAKRSSKEIFSNFEKVLIRFA